MLFNQVVLEPLDLYQTERSIHIWAEFWPENGE
jgi:hypothetical protein